ncbi:MAG: hypothetical protein A2Y07_01165 [Planctomycetes bacterium GWF2_50_10]|nr:MAG: hypothetical protein A2Y07_01165 [Planctomycetes bacterium GWF2_50_10]
MADIDRIVTILEESKDEHKKQISCVRLERILEKKTISELNQIIKSINNNVIIHRAKFEIWRKKLDRTPANLLNIIHYDDDDDRICEAITELGQQTRDTVDLFIKLLKDKRSFVRTHAALALLDNPTQKALKPLITAIKKNKNNCAVCVHALEVLDCTVAAEFLIDLFISKPNAPMVRLNIIECFEGDAIRSIPAEIGKKIKTTIFKAIQKSKDETDKYEIRRFYDEAIKPKIEKRLKRP